MMLELHVQFNRLVTQPAVIGVEIGHILAEFIQWGFINDVNFGIFIPLCVYNRYFNL
jgi:hypothetical protein